MQAGIKIARRNINNLRYANDTTLMAESKEELNSLLMKVKEESVKAGLRFNIQKTKACCKTVIMLSIIKIPKIKTPLLPFWVLLCFMAESEKELKSLLMKVKEESKKFGLKLNIQKTKIMASGPISSWQIDGEQWK